MKRSYPANIDGQIFYIDEDAFILLQNYLQELKNTFTGAEGLEIVGDIESRIREHFAEKVENGASVIILSDVNTVIATMGRPEELSEDSPATGQPAAADNHGPSPAPERTREFMNGRKLFRNMQNKVFGGVIGGLATYFNWNANIFRLIIVIVAIFSYVVPWVIIYLVLWMVIPPAITPRQILQMHGEPVNVDTVGQTVIAHTDTGTTPPPCIENEDANFVKVFFTTATKILMGFVGFVAGIMDLGLIIAFIVLAIGATVLAITGTGFIIDTLPNNLINAPAWLMISVWLVWVLVGIIAMSALVWTSLCFVASTRAASRATVITTLIIEVLLIATGIALSLSLNTYY